MAVIRIKSGTRSEITTAAGVDGLLAREPYYVSDEQRLAVGVGTGESRDVLMQGEQRISLAPHDLGTLGATPTIPFDTHQNIRATVGANATLTFATPPDSTHCRLLITATDTATITLPSGLYIVGSIPAGTLDLTNGDRLWINAQRDGEWYVGVSKITETT